MSRSLIPHGQATFPVMVSINQKAPNWQLTDVGHSFSTLVHCVDAAYTNFVQTIIL